MTLGLYIARRYLAALIRVGLIVLAIMSLFEVIEHFRRYADANATTADILSLAALAIPPQIDQVLPLIFLISGISVFLGLARSSELVVSRAAGLSAARIVVIPVITAFLVGIAIVAVFSPILAASNRIHDQMRADLLNTGQALLSVTEGGVWLRQVHDGQRTVISAQRSSPDGTTLYTVDFQVFDPNSKLSERILATAARLDGARWRLQDVRRWDLSGETVPRMQTATEAELGTNLTPDQILDGFARPDTISVWDLPSFIQAMQISGFEATRHRLYLNSVLSLPLVLAGMVMIAAAFTLRHVRFGNTGVMVIVTVLSGFAFYALRSVAGSLGATGMLPISIATWMPPLAVILAVTGLLLHLEDG